MRARVFILVTVALLVLAGTARAQPTVVIGSKKFNESYILGEIMAQLLESRGIEVDRRFGLGGTLVCYTALRETDIDIYAEYSGTIEQAILKRSSRSSLDDLRPLVREETGLSILDSFGFNNTYAIACQRDFAERHGLQRVSELAGVDGIRYGFSHEFLERDDGWPGLSEVYGLRETPRGVEHGLAYQAIDNGQIDVTDVYSTDGDIEKYGLVLLDDDRGFFPEYMAAPLIHGGVSGPVRDALRSLAGRIDEARMRALNAAVLIEGQTFAEVAAAFLQEEGLVADRSRAANASFWPTLLARTGVHLQLTGLALLASLFVAIPLGILVYRSRGAANAVMYVAGVLQTIPSIALLAFMIPLLGIGALPAIVALFLYALLPILRNTTSALVSLDPVLKKVAVGMGLTPWQRLRHIELPLAAPTILAGIKTAAVINIGTATLAAFIGAGGLGEPIVTGLALNDTKLILQGAIPAAVLAVLTELVFEGIERAAFPRHLAQAAPR